MSHPKAATAETVLAPAAEAPAVVRIEPARGIAALRLGDVWEHRELLYFLTWRDLKVRYRQTLIGVSWAILQPVLTMVVFTLVFGRLARMPSDGLPYSIFVYCALVPWTFFSTALVQASNSVVSSAHLVRKVYFPRLVLPISAALAACVDFVLAFVVLFVIAFARGIVPTPRLVAVPLFALLGLTVALGVGIGLAALHVKYRDVRFVVPFLVQLWLFATPVAYPSSLLPAAWRPWYGLNPMVGVVEGLRWAVLGTAAPDPRVLGLSVATALILLGAGTLYFRRVEIDFADVV